MASASAQHEPQEPVVERAIGEMAAACQTIHKDLNELKRAIALEGPATKARPRAGQSSG